MDFPPLDAGQTRVLGTLLEKAATTPDAYPLTTNALQSGCNQKSNRDPVMMLADFEIDGILRSLEMERLVARLSGAGSRTVRYRERLSEVLGLEEGESAVIAELLLRGPQQPGALRTRAARMAPIPDLPSLQSILDGLAARPTPLVRNLGRRDGERAPRWTHALGEQQESDPSAVSDLPAAANTDPSPSPMSPPPAAATAAADEPAGPDASDRDGLLRRVEVLEDRLERLEQHLRDAGLEPPTT